MVAVSALPQRLTPPFLQGAFRACRLELCTAGTTGRMRLQRQQGIIQRLKRGLPSPRTLRANMNCAGRRRNAHGPDVRHCERHLVAVGVQRAGLRRLCGHPSRLAPRAARLCGPEPAVAGAAAGCAGVALCRCVACARPPASRLGASGPGRGGPSPQSQVVLAGPSFQGRL